MLISSNNTQNVPAFGLNYTKALRRVYLGAAGRIKKYLQQNSEIANKLRSLEAHPDGLKLSLDAGPYGKPEIRALSPWYPIIQSVNLNKPEEVVSTAIANLEERIEFYKGWRKFKNFVGKIFGK